MLQRSMHIPMPDCDSTGSVWMAPPAPPIRPAPPTNVCYTDGCVGTAGVACTFRTRGASPIVAPEAHARRARAGHCQAPPARTARQESARTTSACEGEMGARRGRVIGAAGALAACIATSSAASSSSVFTAPSWSSPMRAPMPGTTPLWGHDAGLDAGYDAGPDAGYGGARCRIRRRRGRRRAGEPRRALRAHGGCADQTVCVTQTMFVRDRVRAQVRGVLHGEDRAGERNVRVDPPRRGSDGECGDAGGCGGTTMPVPGWGQERRRDRLRLRRRNVSACEGRKACKATPTARPTSPCA